jgi:hypothetical protein
MLSSIISTGNKTHDDVCNKSLVTLQASIAGVTSQATINSAYITHYRNCLASAKLNNGGNGLEPFATALRSLGAGGV